MNEWELWLAAAKLLRAHGATAALEADSKIRQLDEAGDDHGRSQWQTVRERIDELQGQGMRWLS